MTVSVRYSTIKSVTIRAWKSLGGPGKGIWFIFNGDKILSLMKVKRRTHSTRSDNSQWKDLTKSKKRNITPNGMSNSSRNMVNANRDSVTKNHMRSYSR